MRTEPERKLRTILLNGDKALPQAARAVALGLFDGLHIGHRQVISRVAGCQMPDGHMLTAAVFTFSQARWAMTGSDSDARELTTEGAKLRVLKGLGVDEWIRADFEQLRDYTPRRFVDEFLRGVLNARVVSCGFNYRFGQNGAGDASLLCELCAAHGIEVTVVPPVEIDGGPISATRIRRLIEEGHMEQAARLLGRPFTIDFEVVGGQRLGRLLGTPTINQPLPPHFVRPKFGVYAVSAEVDGEVRYGVANVGVRPTQGVEGTEPLCETWIAEYSGDLYGRRVPVSFIKFLRPEQRFESVDGLQKQILIDVKAARAAVMGGEEEDIKAVLFDFDDTLQDREAAFMGYCDFFFAKYFPNMTKREKQEKSMEMLLTNRGGYVVYLDYFESVIRLLEWKDAPPAGELYREFQFRFPEYTTLYHDAESVISQLKSRGLAVGVVTNGVSLIQNRKLDVSGLRHLFDVAVVSGDEKVHKPDPEIFRRAAARLGVACRHCLFVGDHPENDIHGAALAGMRPVFISVSGAFPCPENVPEIRSLTELLHLI